MRLWRTVKLTLKYSLAGLGAWCLVFALAAKWGVWATVWLIAAPLLYGIITALTRSAPPAPSSPPPH